MNLNDYELSKNPAVRQHQVAVLTDPAVQMQKAEVHALLDETKKLELVVEQCRAALREAEAHVAAKQREVTAATKKFCKAQQKAAKRIDLEGA